VAIGSFLRRVAYALRFADYNLVLTGLIEDDSRIIYHRSVTERVAQVAPFLELDSNPYPVVTEDGRVQWIIDAYTTSEAYPYSQRSVLDLGGRQVPVNYVRNSVKAVVDAFDGTVTLYRVEEDDPILDAWEQVFPDLITPVRRPSRRASRRTSATRRTSSGCSPSCSGCTTSRRSTRSTTAPTRGRSRSTRRRPRTRPGAGPRRCDPATARAVLPADASAGETEEEFVLIQPYLAQGRENMVSWLAGRGDGENLNELFAVRFPSNQLVLGPAQAQARIEQDDLISEYITLRQRAGTQVIRGNLQVLPIANSILYVEPLFLQADQAQIPELARVALVLGERTAFDRTFAGALGQLLGIDVPDAIIDAEEGPISVADPVGDDDTPADPDEVDPDEEPDDEPAPDPTPGTGTSTELLEQALAAFARAEVALRDGDLGTYQREVARAQQLLEQAAEQEGIGVEDLGADADADEG
jgi:uncharacterized protein